MRRIETTGELRGRGGAAGRCLLVAVLCLGPVTAARAAGVRAEVSMQETQVGVPVELQVIAEDIRPAEPPVVPAIPDVRIRDRGSPSRQSTMSVVNGAMQTRTMLTFSYELNPQKEGRFTIPAVEVKSSEGKVYRTQPVTVIVAKSQTGDLLLVEVTGNRKKLYVGESLDVTLQIWLKPFVDPQFGKLDPASMWSLVDKESSAWGSFLEILQQMAQRGVQVTGRETLRKDSRGQDRSYYLYEVTRTIVADRPGRLAMDEINILVTYPNRLARTNDLFSMGRLRIVSSQQLAGQAKVEPIDVVPIPTRGRPAYYSGAVGAYTIQATAKPTEVAVGDPITLTMTVSGAGNIQALQPPRLAEVPELNAAFRIPTDPLAGEVAGNSKRFSISIRATSEAVTEIPPVPFAYFDPRQERFVTVKSQPIPLKVKAADRLAVSQIVDSTGSPAAANSRLTEVSGGILANYTGVDEVLSPQGLAPGAVAWLLLVLPPVAFVVSWTARRRSERLRTDVGFARRRKARRRALDRLGPVGTGSPREAAAAVGSALPQYVADRCNLPAGGMTRTRVVEELSGRALPADLVQEVDALLGECESIHYAGDGTRAAAELQAAAVACIERLERERW
jgi:hypothetical protein